MAIQNKAVTATVSIMLAFSLMMAALTCLKILQAQEYTPITSIRNGEIERKKSKTQNIPAKWKKKFIRLSSI